LFVKNFIQKILQEFQKLPMADAIGRQSPPNMHHASGREPTMERTCTALPTTGTPIIFRKIYKNVTHFHEAH